jgi:hypothetical protein
MMIKNLVCCTHPRTIDLPDKGRGRKTEMHWSLEASILRLGFGVQMDIVRQYCMVTTAKWSVPNGYLMGTKLLQLALMEQFDSGRFSLNPRNSGQIINNMPAITKQTADNDDANANGTGVMQIQL